MKVLHVIPSVSPKHGGPSAALPAMARALIAQGVEVTIATTDDDGRGCRLHVPIGTLTNDVDGVQRIHFRKSTEFYKVSLGLGRWLRRSVSEFDVVHVHALFSYPSVAAARAAKAADVPYVVRALGVLNRWGMENRRRMVKHWSLRFVEMPVLRSASMIHYTANAERREAAEAHPEIAEMKSIVIPLPVELPGMEQTASPAAADGAVRGGPVILFLSRIDPKKGVELLLRAFEEIQREVADAVLMLAGDGEREYIDGLKKEVDRLGIGHSVIWAGFLAGELKASALRGATVFVLPSYSENFGIAAAEALAAGVPSILSENVAVADYAKAADAALVVPCEDGAIAAALRQLLAEEELRVHLASNGRNLVRNKFSSEAVGRSLRELYEELTKGRRDA